MNKQEKEAQVAKLNADFNSATSLIVTHYTGLNVDEITALRNSLREKGAVFKVTKNSLAKLALKGTKYEDLTEFFTGPTAIAFSEDPVSAAKGVVDFANDNEKLVILGGALDDKVMDIASIKALAKLPSLDELRAKLISMIQTPATRIAGVVQAPAGQLARVFGAYGKKEG